MAEATLLPAAAATTCDAFLDGRLKLRQPARGHRAGTDAILLAAAVPPDFFGLAVDVGSGVGAAGLALAIRCPGARVRLIENDPEAAALAAANIEANGLAARAHLLRLDVLAPAAPRADTVRADTVRADTARADTARADTARADFVVTNPPFYDAASVRASPDAGRRAAHVMGPGGLAAWVAGCLGLLAPKGTLVVLHRAEAAFALVETLGGSARGITLLPVYPRIGGEATRVLVRAVKGSRAPPRLAPPLVLHEQDGRFTAEADGLHRGTATLCW